MIWFLRYPHRTVFGFVWLVGIGGLYIYLVFDLKAGSPEEAVHYILYGILGILLFRALSHRVHDFSIYILAILVGSMVGILDEAIQWAVPERYFDTRDIWLNVTGVTLAQVAIAFGIRPPLISGYPDALGVRRLSLAGAVLAAILGLSHLNTPNAVAAYSERFPVLAFLKDQDDAMFEYGHLYVDPMFGSFKSRLTPAEFRKANETRAQSGAKIIDRYPKWEGFRDFIKKYPAFKDPFLHEARVHIRSRDVNLNLARKAETGLEADRLFTFAYREHQILERYFGDLYTASHYPWTPEEERRIKAQIIDGLTRQSKVSQHLITTYSLREAVSFFLVLVLGLLTAAYIAGRK